MNSQQYSAGVIGLGSMGMGMAKSCLRAGISTWGFDVSRDRLDDFANSGGLVEDLEGCIDKLDAIIMVVVNGAQVNSILFDGPILADRIRPGAVVMVCTCLLYTSPSPRDA